MFHQGLRAVVTRPDGNAQSIQDRPDIVRVSGSDQERDYGSFLRSRSNNSQSVDLTKLSGSVFE
jgi:hypothetical protein